MPHYFFHLLDGEERTLDREGKSLVNIDAARDEAVNAARDIMAEGLRRGEPLNGQIIEVTDAEGRVLFRLSFRDALPAKWGE